jgi:deoxyribodipyrimidine photo-lyase
MGASEDIGLVWFRRDLRLDDNPAWAAATADRRAVVALFVLERQAFDGAGPYRRRQLVADVQALDEELARRTGGRLLVREGDPATVVPATVTELRAGAVYWNDEVCPSDRRRDEQVRAALRVPVRSWFGSLVLPPGSVRSERGAVPPTFAAFDAQWQATPWDPWPEPGEALVYDRPGRPLPRLDGRPCFLEGTGESASRLDDFVARVDRYLDDRHRLDANGGARLSTALRYGTVSPRAVVRAVAPLTPGHASTPGRQAFLRQLARRDWYAHLLHARPDLVDTALDPSAERVPLRNRAPEISAWKGGFTGYPIVDAGMRQLRETGWLHHRIRTIVATFLVVDLRVDWRIGERHFRHLLVDADVAQNVGNWQSIAGVAPEAMPAARVPSPVTHSRVVDPDGWYIRRWVPELARLGNDHLHAPWTAPGRELARAGIVLGRAYPRPIVDHAVARSGYLEAVREARGGEVTREHPVVVVPRPVEAALPHRPGTPAVG